MKKIIFNYDKILKRHSGGIEGDIYFYNENNNIVFLKLFKNEIIINGNHKNMKETLENKRKKLEIISKSPILKEEINIYDLVYDKNDNFIGYTMKIEKLKTAYDIKNINTKIKILKIIRKKLELFNENDIYIGDFNPKNIILSDKIKLCDLDNLRIGNLDFDALNTFGLLHLKRKFDKNTIDNFSFNLQTISYIGNINPPYIFDYIREEGLPRKLNTKNNKKLLLDLLIFGNNTKNRYFIDNLRKFI